MERNECLPSTINVEEFISSRCKELTALTNFIGESTRVTSIFQRLPKAMRRRAMSHTIRRVPKNLREAHRRQLEKNKALKTQRRCRKYFRRRPINKLLEYNRRQKENLWLETHIWHAKRFHMISKWGYRLAERTCDKTFRASYRASSSHCLLQDISYHCCIEISGPQDILINSLKTINSTECGLTIGAKCWLSGCREGKVTLYHRNSYPYNVIGDVTFFWKPANNDSFRTLWIWCHPAFYDELKQELIDLFNVEEVLLPRNEEVKEVKRTKRRKKLKNVENAKIALKNVPQVKLPKYTSKQGVIIVFLKDTLNRFRLTGPLSNAVLTNALHAAESFDDILLPVSKNWWKEYRNKNTDSLIALKLLQTYEAPSHFPPHVILGGHIIDPRLFLKRIRKKAVPKNQVSESYASLPKNAPECAIWNGDIRDFVTLNKFTTSEINKFRSQLLVPGNDEHLLPKINTVVPILFVQRPGSSESIVKLNYSSGWDIIVPASWSMPVWLSLILCGAKPGGLRETKTLNFESKKMPDLAPDSKAGNTYYEEITISDRNHYFNKAPNKRTNYIINGFTTPFHYPWTTLTNEWCENEVDKPFYVLRNKKVLLQLKSFVENAKNGFKIDPNIISSRSKCLVPVTVHISKGQLSPFSHICLPKSTDLVNIFTSPLEEKHADKNKPERKLLRKHHRKELKRLRNQRIKLNRSSVKKLPSKISKRKKSPTEEIVQKYLETMRDLWLPQKCDAVRNHCSREICGFVVNSGFSFMESRIVGQGYITLQSLYCLSDLWYKFKYDSSVLTRTPNSLNYRFGLLKICVQ